MGDNTLESNRSTYTSRSSVDAELDHWLDSAINSKVHLMQFNSGAKEENFSINLGKLGFKNPNDLKKFLLTPAGDTIKGEMAAEMGNKEAEKEQRTMDLREKEKRKRYLKAHLMLFLIEKKGHAASQLRELIEEQNQQAIERNKTHSTPKQSTATRANKELQEAIRIYDNAIQNYQAQQQSLFEKKQELSDLIEHLKKQKFALLDKHTVYEKSLSNFEDESEQYEQMSPKSLDEKIAEMEAKTHAQIDEITELLDSGELGSEEEARKLLNEQNALNLQLAALYDLRSQKRREKVFLNAQGEIVTSQKDALFVLQNNQKIIEKDGQYYLLNLNENFDDLSAEDQAKAAARFENTKPELMSVKKSVENTLALEKEFHNFDKRIDEADRQQDETQAEKTQLENQIKLLHSVRATLAQSASDLEQGTPRPTPKAGSASMPQALPAPVIAFAQGFLPEFLITRRISTQTLNNKIDKKANSKKDAKAIKDFFKKSLALLGLDKIPSLAPLPETTMISLLQNMARFGADPYKKALAPLQSPLDSQGLAPPIPSPQKLDLDSVEIPHLQASERKSEPEAPKPFNPTPFDTNPYGN